MKWSPTRSALVRGHMTHLGLGGVRVTLRWSPDEEYPRGSTVLALRRAEQAASGRRLVLAVYSKAPDAPKIARLRRAYCGFVVQLPRPRACRERRRDLERTQLAPVLAAPVQSGRNERGRPGLRGSAGGVLGPASRVPAGSERDRGERAARERRSVRGETVRVPRPLLYGAGGRLSGQWS
jgi:hypothetical protein